MIDKSCKTTECKTCNEADCIWRPRTNADRIRAMTDEELAGCLFNLQQEAVVIAMTPYDNFLNWLKQEVQE